MKIILDGTSSAGKSSIMKEFTNQYKKIAMDDKLIEKQFMTLVKNKFYSEKQLFKIIDTYIYNSIKNKTLNEKNFIIDIVHENQKLSNIINFLPNPNTIKHILIYTNLENLVNNINKRKNYNPRGKFIFEQFASYYVKTNNEKKSIDTINLKSFINNLQNIKYEFKNNKDLIDFAKEIFKKLKILDYNDYFIKLQYNKYDLIINTLNKTPNDIHKYILNYYKK